MIIDTEKEEQVLLDYSKMTTGPKPVTISHYKFNTLDGNVNIYETAESYWKSKSENHGACPVDELDLSITYSLYV